MTSIWDRSATAASNTGTPPAGFPENQLASLVDDQFRAEMAFETEFVHSVVAAGTADALTVTYTNIPASLTDGMEIHVRAAAANATTTPTLNVNSLGAKTITKSGGNALVAGDISGNLHELILRYNLANTRWELLNPALGQSLGTGAKYNVGTSANNIVQLDGSAKLPAVDGSQLANIPAGPTGGTTGQSLIKNSNTDHDTKWGQPPLLGLQSVATLSGTAVNFTGIPSTARRITVAIAGLQTNGTSLPLVRVGNVSVVTSGYNNAVAAGSASVISVSANTSGFALSQTNASTAVTHGLVVLTLIDPTANLWAASVTLARSDTGAVEWGAGSITLSSALDRVQLTMVNGTDTFSAGKANVLVE